MNFKRITTVLITICLTLVCVGIVNVFLEDTLPIHTANDILYLKGNMVTSETGDIARRFESISDRNDFIENLTAEDAVIQNWEIVTLVTDYTSVSVDDDGSLRITIDNPYNGFSYSTLFNRMDSIPSSVIYYIED